MWHDHSECRHFENDQLHIQFSSTHWRGTDQISLVGKKIGIGSSACIGHMWAEKVNQIVLLCRCNFSSSFPGLCFSGTFWLSRLICWCCYLSGLMAVWTPTPTHTPPPPAWPWPCTCLLQAAVGGRALAVRGAFLRRSHPVNPLGLDPTASPSSHLHCHPPSHSQCLSCSNKLQLYHVKGRAVWD